jgi:hypothetical protein
MDYSVRRLLVTSSGRKLWQITIDYQRSEEIITPTTWKGIVWGGGGETDVFMYFDATVDEYEAEVEVAPDAFDLEFPPDTRIADYAATRAHDSGAVQYIHRGDGTKRLITAEELRRNPTDEDLVSTESGQALAQLGGISTRMRMALALTCCVAIGVSVWLLRVRARVS